MWPLNDHYNEVLRHSGRKFFISFLGLASISGFFINILLPQKDLFLFSFLNYWSVSVGLLLLYLDFRIYPEISGLRVYDIGFWYKTPNRKLINFSMIIVIAAMIGVNIYSIKKASSLSKRQEEYARTGLEIQGIIVGIDNNRSHRIIEVSTSNGYKFHYKIPSGYILQNGQQITLVFPKDNLSSALPKELPIASEIPPETAWIIVILNIALPFWYYIKHKLLFRLQT